MSPPLRILVITPVYPHAGSPSEGIFNEQHAKAIGDAGATVDVLIVKPWAPKALARITLRYRPLLSLPRGERRGAVSVTSVRYLHVPRYFMMDRTVASCASAVMQWIRHSGRQYDCLQVHSVWPVGLAVGEVSQMIGVPFVVTLHIKDDPPIYASQEGRRHLERMMIGAAMVVGVGSPVAKFIREDYGFPEQKNFVVIPNGIDLETMAKIIPGPMDNKHGWGHIVSVCNLWHLKGIDIVLNALAQLQRHGIREWHYTIVGDGPERRALGRLADDLGISSRVTFAGRLGHEDAVRAIADADIFCLPSRGETFGMVYLEAMACSKPVIGTMGTGAEDLVEDGKTGIIVPQEDSASLAKALESFLVDPAFARTCGAAGKERAALFSWKATSARYMEIYQTAAMQYQQGKG